MWLECRKVVRPYVRSDHVLMLCIPHGGMGDRVVLQALVRSFSKSKTHMVVVSCRQLGKFSVSDYIPTPAEIWIVSKSFFQLLGQRARRGAVSALMNDAFPNCFSREVIWLGGLTDMDKHTTDDFFKIINPYQLLRELANKGIYPEFSVQSDTAQGLREKWGINKQTTLPIVGIHCRRLLHEAGKNLCIRDMVRVVKLIRKQLRAIMVIFGDQDCPAVLLDHCHYRVHADPMLKVTAAALSLCDVFIGGDSGPGHLAAAVGTPVISIQHPGRSGLFGPFGPSARVRIVKGWHKYGMPSELRFDHFALVQLVAKLITGPSKIFDSPSEWKDTEE